MQRGGGIIAYWKELQKKLWVANGKKEKQNSEGEKLKNENCCG
jgi:hypothetical protein